MLQALHPLVGHGQRRSHGRRAMIRHQEGVVVGDERVKGIRQGGSARCGVGDEGDPSHLKDHLGQDAGRERLTSHGEPRRQRRMRMHDGLDIGASLVDAQVHEDLGGGATAAAKVLAIEGDLDQVVDGGIHLRHPGWRDQQSIRADPHGDVAVRSRDQPALVQPLADLHDLASQRQSAAHRPTLRPRHSVGRRSGHPRRYTLRGRSGSSRRRGCSAPWSGTPPGPRSSSPSGQRL